MNPTATLSVSGVGLEGLEKALRQLAKDRVLVGVPEDTADRDMLANGKPPEINNAELLFIHSEGSALRGIPQRRVLQPAVEAPDNWERIDRAMRAVASAEVNGTHDEAVDAMKRAGTVGANACKRWFTDPRNGWPPNAPSTIRRKGSARPLIDLGELRRSITYAYEDK